MEAGMEAGETDATAAVFRLLADEYSRRILLAAEQEPRTAKDLSDVCDASLATVYRRVSTLQEHDLLRKHSTVGSDGSHRRQFETTLEEINVTVSDGELALSVETRDELADDVTSLRTNLRENG
jgi:DNA-binding transcriptional ArsR family regulator